MRLPEPALQELVRGAVLGGHAAGTQSALRLSFPFRFMPPGPSGRVSYLPLGFFSARLSPLRPVGLGKTGCDIREAAGQPQFLASGDPKDLPRCPLPTPVHTRTTLHHPCGSSSPGIQTWCRAGTRGMAGLASSHM